MTSEQFINLLEENRLLPEKAIASLRRQVAESAHDVSAVSIAKLLVKKGRVTKYQARTLLESEVSLQTTDKAVGDEPEIDLSEIGKPEVDKPEADKPASEAPAGKDSPGRSPAESPPEKAPTADKRAKQTPTAEKSTAEEPSVDDLIADAPLMESDAQEATPAEKTAGGAPVSHELEELDDLALTPLDEDSLDAPPPEVPSPPIDSAQGESPDDLFDELPEEVAADDSELETLDNVDVLRDAGVIEFARDDELDKTKAPEAAGSVGDMGLDEIPDAPLLDADAMQLEDDLEPIDDAMSIDEDDVAVGELIDDEPLANRDPRESGSPAVTMAPPRHFKAKGKLTTSSKSQFDTPLMLIGVASLVLLVIIGGVTWWLYNRGAAEKEFNAAEELYADSSYSQAVPQYDRYIENYPKDGNISLAKVHRALAIVRMKRSESSDWEQTFDVAKTQLKRVSGEDALIQSYEDVADILPEIAEGLAGQARAASDAGDSGEAARLAKLTEECLSMNLNIAYVPKQLQNSNRLNAVRSTLELVGRNLSSTTRLNDALDAMEKSLLAGEISAAYAVRKQLILEYPELRDHKRMKEMVAKVSQAELASVHQVNEPIEALTDEAPSPVKASLALAQSDEGSDARAEGHFAVVQTEGAAYGLDAANGELLWRRFLGAQTESSPVRVSAAPDADVLLVDSQHNELLRVASATGKLRWRLPIGQPFSTPVVAGRRALVNDQSGRMLSVDLQTGQATQHAVFPQSLRTSPGVHDEGRFACVVGEHSSVYLVSTDDLKCRQVYYLGHQAGTVRVAPTVLLRTVLVAENWGENTSTLHVFRTDGKGAQLELAEDIRLAGRIITPPIVQGRKVIVTTDRGLIKVFEVAAGAEEKPLVSVAERAADNDAPRVLYAALVGNDQLWVADRRLSKMQIQPASGRLASHPFDDNFEGDAFDRPLQAAGGLLIVLRRRNGHAGQTVAAVDPRGGRKVWQTHIAVPPAGPPRANADSSQIVSGTAEGAVFVLDSDAIKKRVFDKPLVAAKAPAGVVLSTRAELGRDRVAFAGKNRTPYVLVFDPNATPHVKWLQVSSELACAPVGLAGDLIAPTVLGQVFWINPVTGQQAGAPFQPKLSPGTSLDWRRPASVGADGQELILSDGKTKLYRIGVRPDPPHLEMLGQSGELEVPIVSDVAGLDDMALAVDAENFIVSITPTDMKLGPRTDLLGRVVWGPARVGDHCLVANDRQELVCLNARAEVVWRKPLKDGPFGGAPLAVEGGFVMSFQSGALVLVDAKTGAETGRSDLGQSLSSGAAPFGSNILVAGADGTILVTDIPKGTP